jgi:hypothetical protein
VCQLAREIAIMDEEGGLGLLDWEWDARRLQSATAWLVQQRWTWETNNSSEGPDEQ